VFWNIDVYVNFGLNFEQLNFYNYTADKSDISESSSANFWNFIKSLYSFYPFILKALKNFEPINRIVACKG
jgi:hypothetical protein